ncbi:hypothetical protein NC652_002057 [Populus alba x Populus x berolinensis]|nr:hypothetical protein NC652_002057 [Populus alba x Populus x berolinensis]
MMWWRLNCPSNSSGHLYPFLVFLVDDFYKSQFPYPLVIISLRCPLVSCHCDPFFFLLKEMDF